MSADEVSPLQDIERRVQLRTKEISLDIEGFAADPDGEAKPAFVRPWHQRGYSHFWAYYVELDYPTKGTDALAWHRLVPLRSRKALKPAGRNTPRLWRYVWPHAVAAVLDLEIDCRGTPRDEAVSQAVSGATLARYDFGDVVADAAEVLRQVAVALLKDVGGIEDRATHPDRAFSVVTVVEGDLAHEDLPEGNPDIWRSVHGLARLTPRWMSLSPGDPSQRRISCRATRPLRDGGGLYGLARSRVVWLPGPFCTPGNAEALCWYHRNLVDLSLVVEGQLALVRWAATRLGKEGKLPFDAVELVRHAAGNLARLHAAARPGTYRSMSARRHIEDDDDFASVRAVWDHFGLALPSVEERSGSTEKAPHQML